MPGYLHGLPGYLMRALPKIQSPTHEIRSRSIALASTVAAGTSYEKLTATSLQALGFSLTRVGGRSDRGIDLIGHWRLPELDHISQAGHTTVERHDLGRPQKIPVVVQCKAYATSPKPAWIRELQGAIAAAPSDLGGADDALGVLVSKGKLTPGIREALMAAERGVMYVQLETDVNNANVRQFLWNRTVAERVGEDLGTGFVHSMAKDAVVRRELRLLWRGVPLNLCKSELDPSEV